MLEKYRTLVLTNILKKKVSFLSYRTKDEVKFGVLFQTPLFSCKMLPFEMKDETRMNGASERKTM